jgi:hypothetical protein
MVLNEEFPGWGARGATPPWTIEYDIDDRIHGTNVLRTAVGLGPFHHGTVNSVSLVLHH